MQLQTNHTERLSRRKSHHIGEVGVQRDQNWAVVNGEEHHLAIGGSCKTSLKDCNRVVAFRSQLGRVKRREVFVQEKPH